MTFLRPKVGDRIEILESFPPYYKEGEKGTVVGIKLGDWVTIRFDDYNPNRKAWLGEAGHGYGFHKADFYDNGIIKIIPKKKKNNILV